MPPVYRGSRLCGAVVLAPPDAPSQDTTSDLLLLLHRFAVIDPRDPLTPSWTGVGQCAALVALGALCPCTYSIVASTMDLVHARIFRPATHPRLLHKESQITQVPLCAVDQIMTDMMMTLMTDMMIGHDVRYDIVVRLISFICDKKICKALN